MVQWRDGRGRGVGGGKGRGRDGREGKGGKGRGRDGREGGEGRGGEGRGENKKICKIKLILILLVCTERSLHLVDPAAHHVILHQVADGLPGTCRDEVGGVAKENGAVGECAATGV